jgi:signal transduction histidine kinase
MVPSMAFFGGQAGLIAELLVLATAATLWIAVSTLLGKQSGDWRLWALLNGLLFGASTLLLLVYSGLFGEPLPLDIVVATSASSGFMSAVASALQSLIVRRSSIASATESINAILRDAVAVMDARIVQLRTNVSRHFHNQVQAKIVALALKLAAEPALDDRVRAQSAAGLEEIEQALEVSEQTAVVFETQVDQLAEFWQGALELELQLDPAATELLAVDANLAARVVEVLREGLTNAAKHSTDGKVAVTIESDGSQVLLRMTNLRFDGLETLAPTGIGAATIGDASTSFTSGPQGKNFVLEARFE